MQSTAIAVGVAAITVAWGAVCAGVWYAVGLWGEGE
jgi:hypothetical protein